MYVCTARRYKLVDTEEEADAEEEAAGVDEEGNKRTERAPLHDGACTASFRT